MIKLCIDNTSKLKEFHLYEPYLYGVMKKNCFLVNDFSKDNSDIENLDIAISDAENILLDNIDSSYEVTIVTELLENGISLIQKLYEVDKYIANNFFNSTIQKTKNITLIVLDYTGNCFVDFSRDYVIDGNSDMFFTKNELLKCEKKLMTTRDRVLFVEELKQIRNSKINCRENEWYLFIFDKMIEHFYDEKIFTLNPDKENDIVDIFTKIMSYYVRKEIVENKLTLRYDMYSKIDYTASDERRFSDMNKIIALLSDLMENTSKTLSRRIYNVNIGLNENKIKSMIMQYSENLKIQLNFLQCTKKNTIKVSQRPMPNFSLKNTFLEPVKIKNQKLTFFRSSRNVQYLDKIEKYVTESINKRIRKVKRNNTQNVCELRTLRYGDNKNVGMEKLTLIELKDRIEEKTREYKKKNFDAYNNKVNYYKVLEEFLEGQKIKKEKILSLMNKKVKVKPFILFILLFYIIAVLFVMVSSPELSDRITDKELLFMTLGFVILANILTVVGIMITDNIKINKKIDEYIEFVNECNSKLQISSDEEIEKLGRTYELIILNSDIEYYKANYEKLLNDISKYEFHIAQVEKHINVAKRLCDRIGVNFDEIIIANDYMYDEKNIDIDVEKDVYDNECYNVTHFLFDSNDYCLMLNSGEVIEQSPLKTYIKSINFTEDEVYRF